MAHSDSEHFGRESVGRHGRYERPEESPNFRKLAVDGRRLTKNGNRVEFWVMNFFGCFARPKSIPGLSN